MGCRKMTRAKKQRWIRARNGTCEAGVCVHLRGVFVDDLCDPPGQALVHLAGLQAELAPPRHLHLATDRQENGQREREEEGEA